MLSAGRSRRRTLRLLIPLAIAAVLWAGADIANGIMRLHQKNATEVFSTPDIADIPAEYAKILGLLKGQDEGSLYVLKKNAGRRSVLHKTKATREAVEQFIASQGLRSVSTAPVQWQNVLSSMRVDIREWEDWYSPGDLTAIGMISQQGQAISCELAHNRKSGQVIIFLDPG